MNKDSIKTEERPELMGEMYNLLEKVRPNYGQERVYRRVVGMILGEIMTLGRHTITQILRTLGGISCDWSAFYRVLSEGRFDEKAMGEQVVAETLSHVSEGKPYVVTVDGVIIGRSGKHVGGSSWWPGKNTAVFRRGLVRGQRFVEVAWLTAAEKGYRKAIPLRWLPAVTEKSVPCKAQPQKEWAAGLASLQWVRKVLNQGGEESKRLVAVMDGSYDVQGIWGALPENSTALIRCARNRVLYALPRQAKGPRKRGRPPSYGTRQPAPHAWLHRSKSKRTTTIQVRGRARHLRYWVKGPVLVEGAPECPLFLLVVGGQSWRRGSKRRYRKPTFFLVNAQCQAGKWVLPYAVETLLEWTWQRWECEVAHREMKSALRIGDKQCWGPVSALAAVQWGVWVYALLTLAGYRAWGVVGGPRRQGRWYPSSRRWSFSTLRQAFHAELWDFCDFSPLYARSLDKWLKKHTWMTGLANAHADPAYI